MARERWTVLPVWLAVLGILLAGLCAMGRETEEQLLQRIQSEQNPVKKAKDEIKLANSDSHKSRMPTRRVISKRAQSYSARLSTP